MGQRQRVVMPKLKKIKMWCSLMFLLPWFFMILISILLWSGFFSVECSWFISNLMFMIYFQLFFGFAKRCVVWLGDGVTLLEKSCFFSDSWWRPLTWPNLWSPCFFSFPDVGALMMSHPCVQHLLGCKSFVGFLRASDGSSFHWADCLMGMWHLFSYLFFLGTCSSFWFKWPSPVRLANCYSSGGPA